MKNARRDDPGTSHDAGRMIEKTGAARRHRDEVLAKVRLLPGRTSAELEDFLGWPRYRAGKRLPELRRAGLIRNGTPRKCTVTNITSQTWYPVDEQPPRLFE